MNDFYHNLYIVIFAVVGVASMVLAGLNLKLNPENLSEVESLPRSKWLGMLFGVPALCWCVPHTEVIIFDFMVPYLYWIVAVLAVLSFFFLDYLFARAFGGVLIILSYYSVHSAFEYHSNLYSVTIIAWLLGILGIFLSGKPALLRDILRRSAASCKVRRFISAFLALTGLVYLLNSILEMFK